jgi:AraC-like DNA-binding protein
VPVWPDNGIDIRLVTFTMRVTDQRGIGNRSRFQPKGGIVEEPQRCPFSFHSWRAWRISGDPHPARELRWVAECHHFVLVADGVFQNRWNHSGCDTDYTCRTGHVDYWCADGELNTILATPSTPYDVCFLAVPRQHLAELATSDEVDGAVMYRSQQAIDDDLLRRSLIALAVAPFPGESKEEHARALSLRIVELMGGGTPSWQKDQSVFTTRTMGDIVESIDAHLRCPISLSEMALSAGLSPSHFAKKFRVSSGLSLERFVHLRRIRTAIGRLQSGPENLASIALELGFCSQSHMTRVFTSVTGMSPGSYRRQFRPTVG